MVNLGEELRVECSQEPPSLEKIQSIVQRDPEAVKYEDEYDQIPLHYACYNQAPLTVVEYLLQQWPRSIKIGGFRRGVALHYA